MKKMLKTSSFIIFMMCISITMSCKKDNLTETPTKIKLGDKTSVTPETPNPGGGLGSYVVMNENGEYVTGYAGGINFGSTFVYPLSVQSYENGTPYAPFYYGGYSPMNMLSWTDHGTSFVMLLGTIVGGVPIYDLNAQTNLGIQNYQNDVAKFLGGDLTVLPTLPEHMTRVGGNSTGIITVTGTFVLDNASPTNVSVTDITYRVAPGLPPLID